MTSNDSPYQVAEATLAICNTLTDLDVTVCHLDVEVTRGGVNVVVQIPGFDVHAVDLLGVHLGLAYDAGLSAAHNYRRAGEVLVYGHRLSVVAFTGRPESMRHAS